MSHHASHPAMEREVINQSDVGSLDSVMQTTTADTAPAEGGVSADPFDQSIQTEALPADFDPNVDPNAPPAPPDDGKHSVKLTLGEKGWKLKEGGHWMANITAKSTGDRPFTLFDYPSTQSFGDSNGNRVAALIKAITGAPAQARDTKGQAAELGTLLKSEPIVTAETRWEASCQSCQDAPSKPGGKPRNHVIGKKGQRNFPPVKMVNGKQTYNHQVVCDKCGATVGAQARLVRYVASGAAQAVGAGPDLGGSPFLS